MLKSSLEENRNCSFLFAIFLIFLATVNSEWLQRTFTSTTLKQVSYTAVTWPEDGTVLAAGGQTSGVIIRSTDYGVTWSQVSKNVSFSPIYGLASKTVGGITYYIAVDDSAEIFTANGTGEAWKLATQVSGALYGVTIGLNGNAYISGGTSAQVYRASNSTKYKTWTLKNPTTSGTLYGISSYDGVNVIAVGSTNAGSPRIYYSYASANSWSQTSSTGASGVIYCVSHGNATFAMAAGQSAYIARTYNGGKTWSTMSVFSSTSTIIRYQALSVLSTSEAYVSGSTGQIYKTVNGGNSWSLLVSTRSTLTSLSMYSSSRGVAGVLTGGGLYALVPSKFFILFS
jgi:photosystem II stability/assembly factor-like uncharacterized protein